MNARELLSAQVCLCTLTRLYTLTHRTYTRAQVCTVLYPTTVPHRNATTCPALPCEASVLLSSTWGRRDDRRDVVPGRFDVREDEGHVSRHDSASLIGAADLGASGLYYLQ